MSELADLFCQRSDTGGDPFIPRTLIVQSFGLGQWLKLQLAQRHGIATNVDCVLPATFLWRLYQSLIPDTRQLAESPFDAERLTWRVMRLIDANPSLSGTITDYLAGSGDRDLRLFQLSQEIALLFDEYLMYRPQWMLDWKDGPSEEQGHASWQAELWRLIMEDLPDYRHLHRAALHGQVLQHLETDTTELPWQQLSVFGLSTMPPLQLQTFEALSENTDIDIYFLNPCRHYWGDIVSEKDKARRSIRSLVTSDAPLSDEDYLEIGNPLLSSLGKQGREYLELLLEADRIQSEESFVEFNPDSMLNLVKNDILELTFGGSFESAAPSPSDVSDATIQVHACHSRLREVEVLHDEILRTISQDPTLKPNDIIVMVPDVADYTPFIQSVFTGSINFRITDTNNLSNGTLLESVLSLLELPRSRLSGPNVMDLLEVPAVMRRFDLAAGDLETIAHWIDAAEIRWEVSGSKKAQLWDLPDEHQNTWRFGLDRLLLGFSMTPAQGLWEGTVPLEISPSESELLGTLCHILDLLDHYREQLATEKNVTEWQALITALIDDFFVAAGDEILDINLLLQQLDALTSSATSACFETPFSHQLLAHAIRQGVSSTPSRAGFITGGITFANLVPMRSIPFRMVCLLGINDGEYPRDIRPHSFDLIASAPPARGDRSKKLDDRYLFLEALLSAEDYFYTSYIGKGIRDNKDRPPSAVLGEFLDYLSNVFEQFKPIEHALQPFNPRYYEKGERRSYTETWYRALTNTDTQPFLSAPLKADPAFECNSVAQLTSFLRHPGRYFLQQRLGVYLDRDEVDLRDVESFELDNLERFHLADQALTILVSGDDLDEFRQQQLNSGRVMTGAIGNRQLEQEIDRAESIFKAAVPYLNGEPQRLITDVTVGDQRLALRLTNIFDDQLVSQRAGRLGARHYLTTWVEHLAANVGQHF
ncbi:MAG: exodeoxyribonuclease V subunit gamma, partial [Gammaproteobacteria bacterium]|nr:exodeoxyribonuclease V subunit gamma [Gammaproteobacteria bacterium]